MVASDKAQLKSFGELFRQTRDSYTEKLQPILALSAAVAVGTVLTALVSNGPLRFLLGFITAIVSVLASICYNYLLDGKTAKLELSDLVKLGASKIVPVILTVILLTLIVVGGFILLIIPGIVFLVWFTFVTQVVIFEDKSGMQALKQSREYVRNRWWGVFGRLILAGLVLMGLGLAFSILVSVLAAAMGSGADVLNDIFSAFVITPLSAIFGYHLYRSAVETHTQAK